MSVDAAVAGIDRAAIGLIVIEVAGDEQRPTVEGVMRASGQDDAVSADVVGAAVGYCDYAAGAGEGGRGIAVEPGILVRRIIAVEPSAGVVVPV